MPEKHRDYRPDPYFIDPTPPSYRRPSTAAWVAAVAVAFAVFMLGGFIRTQQQLESIRTESRREIQELRENSLNLQRSLESLIATGGVNRPLGQSRSAPPPVEVRRAEPEPPARPLETGLAEPYLPGLDPIGARRTESPLLASASNLAGLAVNRAEARPARPAATNERRYRVIAVNSEQKILMVEGGRDSAFTEGERLELSRGGRWAGDLRVVTVFDNISACEVLHAVVTPEPGDYVRQSPSGH
ncbi:MAG: hypothetical protein LBU79_03720 [Planctomycetota bacterium]|jgi:hypothetical protein|nr:hypothetical protein [Planctomycetota bacterium]